MSREEALAYWFGASTHTYVAEQRAESVGEAVSFVRAGLAHGTATPSPTVAVKNRPIVGTYILRPNQAGPGAHVANASFMVAPDASGPKNGRALSQRGTPAGLSRNAIQFCRFHEHIRDPPLAETRFQNCRDFTWRISSSRGGLCRRVRHVRFVVAHE